MKDPSTARRSLMKGLTWETFSYFLTFMITYLFLEDLTVSIMLTTYCFVFKIAFFFLHERIWHQVTWGKQATERNLNV